MFKPRFKILIQVLFLVISLLCVASCAHKSGHHNRRDRQSSTEPQHSVEPVKETKERKIEGHTKVKMRQENGICYVPIEVNGLNLDFIFDTGASIISISSAEATVMVRQGMITEKDFVSSQSFINANGDVSEGAVIILRSVKIGDISLENVEASVVDNLNAPLLLGQTALAKFGKVTIDYDNNTIEFN